MTTRKPKTNSFSGQARPANVIALRERIEQFVLENAGPHSADEIADAVGADRKAVRRKLANMVTDNSMVNNSPGKAIGAYQHYSHWLAQQPARRDDPITNSRAPNGSLAYWRAFMARFNEPPRVPR